MPHLANRTRCVVMLSTIIYAAPACLPAVDASCVQPFDVYLNQLQDEVHRHRCVNCL